MQVNHSLYKDQRTKEYELNNQQLRANLFNYCKIRLRENSKCYYYYGCPKWKLLLIIQKGESTQNGYGSKVRSFCQLCSQCHEVSILNFPFGLMLCECLVFAVARFDFSLGEPAYHQEVLENLKAAVKSTKKLCAVCIYIPY